MSLLTQTEPTPSRVAGVFRYVLGTRGRKVSSDTLMGVLSPRSLRNTARKGSTTEHGAAPDPGEADMLARVVEAAIGVGLLSRAEGGMISLCQGLDPAECDLKSLSAVLPLTLARLVFSSTNDANHDLAVWIAWLLAHDLDEAPANWAAIQASLETHPPPDVAKLNDARFTQLEDWACYLGFAWRHAPEGKTALVPDPTAFIRRVLPNLLPIGSQISLATFFRDLADRAPVLDGGRFRVAVEGAWGERADHYISATTALAVLRLRDEGILALESQSDAEVFAFQDRDQVERFTHVSRKGPRGPKGTS